MAIATLPTTQTEIRIVFTEDPDVRKKNDEDRGWIPLKDANAAKGADILDVVPLNVDQRAAAADADGFFSRGLSRARAMIRRVNGKDDRATIEEWLEACPEDVIGLLGIFGRAITNGDDPQEAQRELFRVVPGIRCNADTQDTDSE